MTIASILKHKGRAIVSVSPTDTIEQVTQTLAERRIGAVLVLDTADQVLGIVSERDIIRALAVHGAQTLRMSAAQLMTRDIITASPATTVAQAMAIMTSGRFRHLPVVESGALVGLVSIGDVVKARADIQDHEVDSLRSYVAGSI